MLLLFQAKLIGDFNLEHQCSMILQLQWEVQIWLVGLLGFYGISTFVGYLMQNPFLCK